MNSPSHWRQQADNSKLDQVLKFEVTEVFCGVPRSVSVVDRIKDEDHREHCQWPRNGSEYPRSGGFACDSRASIARRLAGI